MLKEYVLRTIESLRGEIFKKYKVKKIGLFGSLIKGNAREDSDIDILAEFKEDADLFDFLGLIVFLEAKLNHKVDLVPKSALRPELKELILKEVAYI